MPRQSKGTVAVLGIDIGQEYLHPEWNYAIRSRRARQTQQL
jgi:hypothetical protein